jgi:hypothetical protein
MTFLRGSYGDLFMLQRHLTTSPPTRALVSRGRRAATIAPESEQEREEREPELVDQRKRIGQRQVERGQHREDQEQGREPEVQSADEARQERHTPSI